MRRSEWQLILYFLYTSILALTLDHLFQSEQAYLRQNRFKVEFGTFDWRLNDLTGGRID